MARGKPSVLSRKPGSTVRAARKKRAEAGFRTGELPNTPPAELKDMPAGRAAWRAIMRAHDQLPGELYNSLDKSFLINYCMAVEARQRAQDLQVKISKDYQDGKAVLQDLLKVRAELRMAQRLVSDLEKQLYLTPKSRGGVTPPAKEKSADEIIASELAALDRMLGGENQDDRVS